MRQDVAFTTAVQGAIMAIVGPSLPITNPGHSLLLSLAFTVAMYGRRSTKRLYWYMVSYLTRAREIEISLGMQLISRAGEDIRALQVTGDGRVHRVLHSNSIHMGIHRNLELGRLPSIEIHHFFRWSIRTASEPCNRDLARVLANGPEVSTRSLRGVRGRF